MARGGYLLELLRPAAPGVGRSPAVIATRNGALRALQVRSRSHHREQPQNILRAPLPEVVAPPPYARPKVAVHESSSSRTLRSRHHHQAHITRAPVAPPVPVVRHAPIVSPTSTSRVVGRRTHHQARITRTPVAAPPASRLVVSPSSGSRTLRSHRHHQARISSSVRGAPAPFFRPKVVVHGGGRRSSVARGYVGHHELPRITRAPMPPPAFVRSRPVIVRNARRSATSSALAHGRGAALLRRPPRLAPTPPYFRPKILVLARGPDVSHRYVHTSSSRFMRSSVIGAPAAVHAPRHSLTRAQVRYLGRRRRTTP